MDNVEVAGRLIPVFSVNTLIIGSGAAALNAAVQLAALGQKDICIVTDCWGGGTSNNAGSDKQTYYKLSLAGDIPDSARAMAEDLYKGGCMHGDIALCEAQNSARSFYHLVQLGVPFPHDRFGAHVGYKTDHDPRQRGTSAGPLTSHLMFSRLAEKVKELGIPVLDGHEIISLLTEGIGENKKVVGAVALDRDNLDEENHGLVLLNAVNVILGTGGPAGIYHTSVYPESQLGSHGLAFSVGVRGQNLTESQFGLASIKFRWNLSGTYQQVIPRYVSTDRNGGDEREFLNDYFPDMGCLASAIFFKGYQWPFDPRKIADYGSSLIDVLVYQETVIKGRRVFLDYLRNPTGAGKLQDFSFDLLNVEAYSYLEKSDALFGTPIERLARMNQPAIDLYLDHDIDIRREYLEIAVCAQHNNGGLKSNIWWESNIRHLFPVGEVNGTHGVYRPGGSALNSGQVGGLRAAQFIAARYGEPPPDSPTFLTNVNDQVECLVSRIEAMTVTGNRSKTPALMHVRESIQERMSSCGAHIRDPDKVKKAAGEAKALYYKMQENITVASPAELPAAFRNLDLCLTHWLYLEAIHEYLRQGGKSRGSFMVFDGEGEKPCPEMDESWRFSLQDSKNFTAKKILEIAFSEEGTVEKEWVNVRPIPLEEDWFETVWNRFRNDNVIG
ncbi:MAG: FAD-binding protein [Acidobacteria bacterium]|nr:FAD-binding protein [Acidobacteriota bacterium]MCG2814543.1 FAD-binding protein [Candidatus Aminicenantes bacterium]